MAVTRKQIAAAFKRARAKMWDGKTGRNTKHEFICHAITETSKGDVFGVSEKARQTIMSRLDGHGTVEAWLVEKARVMTWKQTPSMRPEIQAHRIAWLKKLEAEFGGE